MDLNSLFKDFCTFDLYDGFLKSFEPVGYSFFHSRKADDTMVYLFEMPGLKKEDIKLSFESGKLNVKAERVIPGIERKYNFDVMLGNGVESSDISSKLEDGILSIIIKDKSKKELTEIKIE